MRIFDTNKLENQDDQIINWIEYVIIIGSRLFQDLHYNQYKIIKILLIKLRKIFSVREIICINVEI